MEFKKVSVNNEKKDLCKYFLSFFEEIDDVFPEMCNNPLISLTEEKYQESMQFYREKNENEILNMLLIDILKSNIIYLFLKEKNEKQDIQIEITDIPLFNTFLLQSISEAIALGEIYHMEPKTLILYGFIYSKIYFHRILESKKEFKEHKNKVCKPLEKMFNKEYSFIYSNKMYEAYCESYLR